MAKTETKPKTEMGTSDTNRKNAHTLDWSGNAWFAGDITIGADEKRLATQEYIDEKSLASFGTWNIAEQVDGITKRLAISSKTGISQSPDKWRLVAANRDISGQLELTEDFTTASAIFDNDDVYVVFEKESCELYRCRINSEADSGQLNISVAEVLEHIIRCNNSFILQLDDKVSKVDGKDLSSNDYTNGEKEKLAMIDLNGQPGDFTAADRQFLNNINNDFVTTQNDVVSLQSDLAALEDDMMALRNERETADNNLNRKIEEETSAIINQKGKAEGIATLNEEGVIPSKQLPNINIYVGEILLYFVSFFDIDSDGNCYLREDGAGAYLIHVPIDGIPRLRNVMSLEN